MTISERAITTGPVVLVNCDRVVLLDEILRNKLQKPARIRIVFDKNFALKQSRLILMYNGYIAHNKLL